MMKLIADSGSTKTDWCVIDSKGDVACRFAGQGINPFQQERSVIEAIVLDEVKGRVPDAQSINEIYFYGAGCREEMRPMMAQILCSSFTNASVIEVNSDLLAAARALFADGEGVACILGTGSNSCLYDGKRITANVPPLGYILGDEGSGAVLGRMFINALFKGRLSTALRDKYFADTGYSLSSIIQRVYREPLANRFLANTSLFIHKNLDDKELNALVIENFCRFFQSNVAGYNRKNLPIGAIGSMAFHYENQLRKAAEVEGFCVSKILKSPMEGLINYHSHTPVRDSAKVRLTI